MIGAKSPYGPCPRLEAKFLTARIHGKLPTTRLRIKSHNQSMTVPARVVASGRLSGTCSNGVAIDLLSFSQPEFPTIRQRAAISVPVKFDGGAQDLLRMQTVIPFFKGVSEPVGLLTPICQREIRFGK